MFTTTITGEDQIINRMKSFESDVWKELQQNIKAAANVIGESARILTPGNPTEPAMTPGWTANGRLGWNEASVDRSIKSKFRSRQVRGQRYVMGVVDMNNPAGSLWALAGSKTSTQFGSLMNRYWGTQYPRALGPAWTVNVDQVRDMMQQAVDDAARKVAF